MRLKRLLALLPFAFVAVGVVPAPGAEALVCDQEPLRSSYTFQRVFCDPWGPVFLP